MVVQRIFDSPVVPRHIAAAEERVERIDGRAYNMAGASEAHYFIETAITAFLTRQTTKTCIPFTSNTAVALPDDNYVFPDASFACDPKFTKEGSAFLTNPTVVFEILSPTTEMRDKGRKAQLYRVLASVVAYVIVSTDEIAVEIYERTGDQWTSRLLIGPGAEAVFDPFTEPLRTDELYARVTFDDEPQKEAKASGA